MPSGVIIIYAYAVVCVCMTIYNIAYNLFQEGRDRRVDRRTQKLKARIGLQLSRMERGEPLDVEHLRNLQREMVKVNELVAFDRAFEQVSKTGKSETVEEYRRRIQPLLIRLTDVYRNKESMQAAYYAYILSRYCKPGDADVSLAEAIMVEYMEKDNLYCRLNALRALYQFGSPERVAEVVAYQDRLGRFLHEKLLTDGLLTFQGDHQRLIALLWERFSQLSDKSRLAVLNYIRFHSGDYIEQMRNIMEDTGENKELRLSAIRYFGKYLYMPVKDRLVAFALDKDPLNWEYAAIAVSCLTDYPGDDVTDALMEAVYSSNWYVRYNAAAGLESRGLEYSDLINVVGGGDRYAREMIMYQLDERRMKLGEYPEQEAKT